MGNSLVIARRELGSVFARPLAYVFAAVFLALGGWLFTRHFVPGEEASLHLLFMDLVTALVVVIPILTMPLISEELSRGTIETMMTAPVTETQMVLGKFLGVFIFYLFLLAMTLLYMVLVAIYGQPEPGQALMGYAGMVLVGAMFISVGLFFSSLTRDQLLAALLSAAVLVALTLGAEELIRRAGGVWRTLIGQVSVSGQFKSFSRGILDTRALAFFLSTTVFFLFTTVKVLESRRWR